MAMPIIPEIAGASGRTWATLDWDGRTHLTFDARSDSPWPITTLAIATHEVGVNCHVGGATRDGVWRSTELTLNPAQGLKLAKAMRFFSQWPTRAVSREIARAFPFQSAEDIDALDSSGLPHTGRDPFRRQLNERTLAAHFPFADVSKIRWPAQKLSAGVVIAHTERWIGTIGDGTNGPLKAFVRELNRDLPERPLTVEDLLLLASFHEALEALRSLGSRVPRKVVEAKAASLLTQRRVLLADNDATAGFRALAKEFDDACAQRTLEGMPPLQKVALARLATQVWMARQVGAGAGPIDLAKVSEVAGRELGRRRGRHLLPFEGGELSFEGWPDGLVVGHGWIVLHTESPAGSWEVVRGGFVAPGPDLLALAWQLAALEEDRRDDLGAANMRAALTRTASGVARNVSEAYGERIALCQRWPGS